MAPPLAGVITSKYSLTVLLLILIASSPPCHAGDNITALLAGHPELGEFCSLLTSTGLTLDIMGRADQLAVLAVDNDGMAPLRSMPREAIRQHLSLHVLLGYIDSDTLGRLQSPSDVVDLSTMFQPSGNPRGVGMVRVSGPDSGNLEDVSFAPSVPAVGPGDWRLAFFVRSMYEDPYRMAVLQVSATMSAPGLPGTSARRDATGRDAAALDATGGGAKKN